MSHKIKIKNLILLLVFVLGAFSLSAQSNFSFQKIGDTKDKIQFEFVNNLMIIPVSINGVELSFLLDTGVEKTILFSLAQGDSIQLNDAVSIDLRGLGQGQPIDAFQSSNNRMEIGDLVSTDLVLYIVFNYDTNFSRFLGIPVHGIIGYDFFKNFIVEVNYSRTFIKVYDPFTYDEKCRNCETKPLFFNNKKPYLKTQARVLDKLVDVTLLVDSGASDALWLFPSDEIEVPENYFEDFLGFGFSGPIYGKRSKITSFFLGKFEFKDINTSFPDSLALSQFKMHVLKDGLIGSEILKRFDLVIDYPNHRLSFKPNRFFDDPFYYNMSGLVIRYSGMEVVKDREYINIGEFNQGTELQSKNNFKRKLYKVKFLLAPQVEIAEVRPGSPALEAGLKKGDILREINGQDAYDYTLAELSQLFSSDVGKKIKMEVLRDGKEITTKFRLKKML